MSHRLLVVSPQAEVDTPQAARRALLIRFPYGVFFRLKPELIKVVAVIHLSRHPATWQRRR